MSQCRFWLDRFWAVKICMVVAALGIAGCHGGTSDTPNKPASNKPVAKIVSITPSTPFVNQPVSFDGAGKGTGNITYHWDFGDNTSGQESQLEHTYTVAGTYPVKLTVTDATGASATATSQVVIAQTPPAPTIPAILLLTRSLHLVASSPIPLTAIAKSVNGGSLDYTWDFGDGNTTAGQTVRHAYDAPGTYTVAVTATNSAGAQATGSTTLVIEPPASLAPPSLESPSIKGPSEIYIMSSVIFEGNAISGSNAPITFEWNFGDNTPNITGKIASHTFSGPPGRYTVTMTAKDPYGQTVTSSTTVKVMTPPPPANIVIDGPLTIQLGDKASFTARFENPAGNAVTYNWDFGDGATSSAAEPTHTYTQTGSYLVQFTVTDAFAGSASGSMTVNVEQDNSLVDLKCQEGEGKGWCLGPSAPIGQTALNGVVFANANNGWVIGENGKIAKSTDGGLTWTEQLSAESVLRGIAAADSKHAWATNGNDILITANGGATWQTVPTGTPAALQALTFPDTQHGWAVGEQATILRTVDGGNTWTVQNSDADKSALESVDFADVNHGLAVGGEKDILGTDNGGQTWKVLYQAEAVLKQVSMPNAKTAYVAGMSGVILKTTDGGLSWKAVSPPSARSTTFVSIKFVTPTTGWVANEAGRIYRTDDGGATWQNQSTPPEASGIASLEAINVNEAWVVTKAGGYMLSVTGGN